MMDMDYHTIKYFRLPIDENNDFGCRILSTCGGYGYEVHITLLALKTVEDHIKPWFSKDGEFLNYNIVSLGDFVNYFSQLNKILNLTIFNMKKLIQFENELQSHRHSIKIASDFFNQKQIIASERSFLNLNPDLRRASESDVFYLEYSFCLKKNLSTKGRIVLTASRIDRFMEIILSK